MFLKRYVFFYSVVFLGLFSQPLLHTYTRPSNVDSPTWHSVYPYLLPETHPLKYRLDEIFNAYTINLLDCVENLEAAGFVEVEIHHGSGTHIMRHPKLKGYIVKAYTEDNEAAPHAWERCIARCEGARVVKKSIKKLGYKKYFDAPNKYIYPVSKSSLVRFLVLAEELPIYDEVKNKKYWKTKIDAAFLQRFYNILKDAGLADSININNSSFGKHRKIYFIDTEHFNKWPPFYRSFLRRIDPKLHAEWLRLNEQ